MQLLAHMGWQAWLWARCSPAKVRSATLWGCLDVTPTRHAPLPFLVSLKFCENFCVTLLPVPVSALSVLHWP